jgi:tRNA pseudouridine55 synthase
MKPIPFPALLRTFNAGPERLLWRVPGIHLVDKPAGISSHDVVSAARRRLGLRRVGHGGTLDPMATGLLLILAGNATRLFDRMQDFDKRYEARLQLGVRTDTQDSTGAILEQRPVPVLSEADADAALERFRGEILQTPPMYSALKKNGVPLYKLAREGKEVKREPRSVTVRALECLGIDADEMRLSMSVSKGFYVRALIDDLGQALGCGATMTALRRTGIGPFDAGQAVPPDRLRPGPEPEIVPS